MKTAVLLLNMGGPSNLDEVELFLRNMFADENILPMHPRLRSMIAKRIIASRLDEAKENYRRMGGKSPLLEISQSLAQKVQEATALPTYPVMRYVPPFASEVLAKCRAEGVERLVLFPMYPQYSTTTTKSSVEDIERTMQAIGYRAETIVIDPYFDDVRYNRLCVDRILKATEGVDTREYDLILSAHGLPMKIIRRGDVYACQVDANVAVIKALLQQQGVVFREIKRAYQSKVGKGKWLEPNLSDVLRNPTHDKVVIYPIAFTIDNSETLFELNVEHREIAQKLRYRDYRVASCLNDDEAFAAFIADKIGEAIGEDGQ